MYPKQERGPIIWICDEPDFIRVNSRVMDYTKGQTLHQATVGKGGAGLDYACSLRDQDGNVIFRNTEDNGAMQVEVKAKRLSVIYYNYGLKEKFRVNIYANGNHEE